MSSVQGGSVRETRAATKTRPNGGWTSSRPWAGKQSKTGGQQDGHSPKPDHLVLHQTGSTAAFLPEDHQGDDGHQKQQNDPILLLGNIKKKSYSEVPAVPLNARAPRYVPDPLQRRR